MQTARRLYVYLMSGISLGVLVAGLSLLLTVLLETLGLRAGDPLFGDEQAVRERLTLAAALTAVSLPVWAIHWIVAERSVRRDRPGAAAERSSALRGLYFAIAMGALLFALAASAAGLMRTLILAAVGESVDFSDPAGGLALMLVAGAAWGYHVWLRTRDWGVGPIVGAGAWLPRTYLYLSALIGLVMLLLGITSLLELVGRVLLDQPPEFVDDVGAWWASPLATATSQALVGAAIWIGHWWYANRLMADRTWRGASERPARLRLAYFVAVIVTGVIGVIAFLGTGSRHAIEAVLGVAEASGGTELAAVVVHSLLSAALFGLAWWVHARWLRLEAAILELPGRIAAARRFASYAVSLVGLAVGAVGIGWLIGILIDVLLGGDRTLVGDGFWQRELAQSVPAAVLGSAVWIWSWSAVSRRYAQDPMVEAASATRRTSLLLVLGLSVLVGIASLGLILYRLFGTLFGVDLTGDPVSELSTPTGALIVAITVAAYHAIALRRDQALRAQAEAAEAAEALAAPAAPSIITLRLSGPPDIDLDATLTQLRGQLPAGYQLERVTEAG
jgi:hypothetical protein